MQIFIKNAIFIICATYYYFKLSALPGKPKTLISLSIFSIIISLLSIPVEHYLPWLTIPLLVLSTIPCLSHYTKTPLALSIPIGIISHGISYILLVISTTIISIVAVIIPCFRYDNHIIIQLLVSFGILLTMPLPFHIKRLKRGMPFLQNHSHSDTGVLLCTAVLIAGIFLSCNDYNIFYLYLFILIYLCAALVYLYWYHNITKTYLDRLHDRNMTDLNTLLQEKFVYITELEQENKRLSRIIHKDNKLIPAMEYAVKCYLSSLPANPVDIADTGKRLLLELQTFSNERKNILQFHENQCRKFNSTQITSVDNLLHYMQQKALTHNITLNAVISCKLPYFTAHVIPEHEANILIADLLENALIATRYNRRHSILINFSIVSDAYCISVFDSGIPFDKELIRYMGIKQITTHEDDSGSGIGLMTIYKLAEQYRASIIINELFPDTGQFTKEISILFNGLKQFILKTTRTEEEISYLKQRNNIQIIKI